MFKQLLHCSFISMVTAVPTAAQSWWEDTSW